MLTPTLAVFFHVIQAEKNKNEDDEADKENEGMKEKEAEVDQEQEKKEEEKESAEDIKKDKLAEVKTKSPRIPRQPRSIQIKVTLLDNTLYECELDVRTYTFSHTFQKTRFTQGQLGHLS